MDVTSPTTTAAEVAKLVAVTLGIEDRPVTASTPLFGSLPELDSMAVVELMAALERQFGILLDDEDVTEDVFTSVGTLAALVDRKRA
jgi:acyl carrier protein